MISGIEGKRVFLSGSMTGMPDWNRETFAQAEAQCYECGAFEVFNPAADAPHGDDPHSHEHWMRRTIHELTRWVNGTAIEDNEPYWDVLVQLPGWARSEGATLEFIVAKDCGIEIKEVNIDA